MSEPPVRAKSSKADWIVLAHVVVVVVALAVAINLASCQQQKEQPIPEPHKELVQAMMDYCRIYDLPRDKWLEAQRAWGFQNGGNPNVINVWNRAARDKNPVAIKMVRRAADLALGPDKCPILDVLDRPERVPPKPAPSTDGSGGSAAQ